jgi:hypothetical protein
MSPRHQDRKQDTNRDKPHVKTAGIAGRVSAKACLKIRECSSSAHLQAAQRTKHRPATYSGLTCSTGQPLANKAFRRHYLHEGVWLWHRTPRSVLSDAHGASKIRQPVQSEAARTLSVCRCNVECDTCSSTGEGGAAHQTNGHNPAVPGDEDVSSQGKGRRHQHASTGAFAHAKGSRILRRLQAGGCSKDSNKAPPRSAQQVHAAPVHKSNQAPF